MQMCWKRPVHVTLLLNFTEGARWWRRPANDQHRAVCCQAVKWNSTAISLALFDSWKGNARRFLLQSYHACLWSCQGRAKCQLCSMIFHFLKSQSRLRLWTCPGEGRIYQGPAGNSAGSALLEPTIDWGQIGFSWKWSCNVYEVKWL